MQNNEERIFKTLCPIPFSVVNIY